MTSCCLHCRHYATCVKQIGSGLEGSRGGRVVWTCGDQLLTVTGFDRLIVPFLLRLYFVSN